MDLQKQSATTSMTVVPLNQVQRAGVLLRTWFTGFTDTLANIGENASMALGVYKPPYLGTSSLEGRVRALPLVDLSGVAWHALGDACTRL